MDLLLKCSDLKIAISNGTSLKVGRGIDCDLRLFDDPFVSRLHCRINYRDGILSIIDVGSLHGTYVNGINIGTQECRAKAGDKIDVGETTISVSRPLKRLKSRRDTNSNMDVQLDADTRTGSLHQPMPGDDTLG